ncbi:MAG: hypothetical protein A2W28_12905 [Gammaproteobacteria bacterium RBG_16_51_14]|nr:MAG: hypothetical protein A2W28_12905 [Gammaproteobacteria bacterium RBG_16_51_14]
MPRSLWKGQYHAGLVQTEHYLLAYYRYIELNPVHAGMTDDPAGYRWSSYSCYRHARATGVFTDPEPLCSRSLSLVQVYSLSR